MSAQQIEKTNGKLIAALKDAREREIRAAHLYRMLGDRESDNHKRNLFYRLAHEEETHAQKFGERIIAVGGNLPPETSPLRLTDRLFTQVMGTVAILRRMEEEEERNIAAFSAQAEAIESDPVSRALFEEIEEEEEHHAKLLQNVSAPNAPATRLEAMLKREKWHVSTGTWIGDAIYGMNDGLSAVFGIVSGMAGFAGKDLRLVVAAGMMGMLASAISMGASAFLATKAEREVYEAEIGRERREIEEDPEHEREELMLLYQLKGFSEEEARRMAATIAKQPEQFLKTMAQEELGLSDRHFPNPWTSMLTGTVSTAVGGIMPVLPFFFVGGTTAIIASAILSTLAHFAVGAAKSLVTTRSWFASGLEMTLVGVGMGAITFLLGVLFKVG